MIDLLLISLYLGIAGSITLSLATFLAGNRYKTFLLFNLNLIPFYISYISIIIIRDSAFAVLYSKIFVGLSFLLPILALLFSVEYSKYKINSYLKWCNLLLGLFLLVITIFTPYFVSGVESFLEIKNSPSTTLLFRVVYFIYFFPNLFWSLIILYKFSKQNQKAKLVLWGMLIGWIGGCTTILQYYNIPIYPLGNFTVIIYCIFMAYGILGRGLFDSSVVITKGMARVFAIIVLGFIYVLMTYSYNILIPEKNNILSENFINLLFLLVVGESYQFLMKKFQNVQENIIKKPYQYEQISSKIDQILSQVTSDKDLEKGLVDIFEKDLKLSISVIALDKGWIFSKDEKHQINILYNSQDINLSDLEIAAINKIKVATIYYDLESNIKNLLDKTHSSAVVPFIFNNKVLGFILVKQRSKSHYFDYNDFLIFDSLVFQVGNAIDRIKSYTKLVNLESEKIRADFYKSLAGSIAHEIRNPLNSINMLKSEISSVLDNFENELIDSMKKNGDEKKS